MSEWVRDTLLRLADKLGDVAAMASRALHANATLAARVAELEDLRKHEIATWDWDGTPAPTPLVGFRFCSCDACRLLRALVRVGEACTTCERAGCPNGEPPKPEEVKL